MEKMSTNSVIVNVQQQSRLKESQGNEVIKLVSTSKEFHDQNSKSHSEYLYHNNNNGNNSNNATTSNIVMVSGRNNFKLEKCLIDENVHVGKVVIDSKYGDEICSACGTVLGEKMCDENLEYGVQDRIHFTDSTITKKQFLHSIGVDTSANYDGNIIGHDNNDEDNATTTTTILPEQQQHTTKTKKRKKQQCISSSSSPRRKKQKKSYQEAKAKTKTKIDEGQHKHEEEYDHDHDHDDQQMTASDERKQLTETQLLEEGYIFDENKKRYGKWHVSHTGTFDFKYRGASIYKPCVYFMEHLKKAEGTNRLVKEDVIKFVIYCLYVKRIRKENATKEDIQTILSENNMSKFYTSVTQIHARATGKPPKLILEEHKQVLLKQFSLICEYWNRFRKQINRKNLFLYTFTIHILCLLNGYTQYLDMFPLLKNKEKLFKQACKEFPQLLRHMGWSEKLHEI